VATNENGNSEAKTWNIRVGGGDGQRFLAQNDGIVAKVTSGVCRHR